MIFLLHVEWMNGIFRVALKAISRASGMESNNSERRQRFFITFTTFFIFVTFLTFFYFYLNVFFTFMGVIADILFINNLVDIPRDHLLDHPQHSKVMSHSAKSVTISTRTNVLNYSYFPKSYRRLESTWRNIVFAPTIWSFKRQAPRIPLGHLLVSFKRQPIDVSCMFLFLRE